MPEKRYTAEDIIHTLREADVLLAQSRIVAQVCTQFGIADQIYCRWRKNFGGMKVDQPRRRRLWLNDDSCVRSRPSTGTMRGRGTLCSPT